MHTLKESNFFEPLVSIGIPTFNRPQELDNAIESISKQTYTNLEIIIADNASTDPDVAKILDQWREKDKRIRCIRHTKNLGSLKNFTSTLMAASGEYFMWAADDDLRETWFVTRCLEKFKEQPWLAAVTTEVQFICEGLPMPRFRQGESFYGRNLKNRTGLPAALNALNSNYDNLIYALFRRSALFYKDKCVWIDSAKGAGNEIPAILYASMQGGFLVLEEYGFYKKSTVATYLQAKWEICGGRAPPTSRVSNLKIAIATYDYHFKALKEIISSIEVLPLGKFEKIILSIKAWINIHMHFFWMLIGRKPRNNIFSQE